MLVPGTHCSQKNFEIFSALKRGFSTGINRQNNLFLNFFLVFSHHGTKPKELGFFFKIFWLQLVPGTTIQKKN